MRRLCPDLRNSILHIVDRYPCSRLSIRRRRYIGKPSVGEAYAGVGCITPVFAESDEQGTKRCSWLSAKMGSSDGLPSLALRARLGCPVYGPWPRQLPISPKAIYRKAQRWRSLRWVEYHHKLPPSLKAMNSEYVMSPKSALFSYWALFFRIGDC